VRDDSLVTTRYLTTDHLGSSSEITNEVGVVTEAMSYDVFGAKRDPNTWQTYAFGTSPNSTDITDKGYTGQQQLDALGLIHMNGRVQDPYTGRFVSADPTVPDPMYSQAFNRFAYVYNNPMNSVDPSGYDQEFDSNGNPTGSWRIVATVGNGQFQSPFSSQSVSCPPSGCQGATPPISSMPAIAPAPLSPVAAPTGPTAISPDAPDATALPSFAATPDFSKNDLQPLTGSLQFQNFNPDSLSSTCLDCSFQTGNVDWGSAGGSLKYMPLHNGPAPRAGIAGGGGPKAGPNQGVPGSTGPTAPDAADSDVDLLFAQARRAYLQAKHESNVESAVLNNKAMLAGSSSDQFLRNFQKESENSGLISASLVVNGSVELSEIGDEVGLKAAGDLAKNSAKTASSAGAGATFKLLEKAVEGTEIIVLAPKAFGLGVDITNAFKAAHDTASGH
jgi:RHS repeat-associated protein